MLFNGKYLWTETDFSSGHLLVSLCVEYVHGCLYMHLIFGEELIDTN